MLKSLGRFLARQLQALFNFLSRLLGSILEILWKALGPAFQTLFTLLGTIWGRLLATLTLLLSIALSPLVDTVKKAFSFVELLGDSPDVISTLFPDNFQSLCYVAVTYCSLDVLLSCLVTFMLVRAGCYAGKLLFWGARKVASVVRGAGV